jgi:hypothetical protein
MAKSDRILSSFPGYYQATDPYKLLRQVVEQLAQPLEEADTHLFRIQRAHRIKVAENAEDIIRLAAVLGLTAFHFDDIVTDGDLSYEQKLICMRERAQRVARVHLQGLGTLWAVMESAAIFLNATIVPEQRGAALIKHIDAERFSHRAAIEFTHLPGKPRASVYLHENPLRRRRVSLTPRWPMDRWVVENQSFQDAPVRLAIRGVEERTVRPSVFCPRTAEGIVFNGVVPDGETLVIDDASGATLDGQAVDDWMISFQGALADFTLWREARAVREQATDKDPLDRTRAEPLFPPFQQKKAVPKAPIGKSQWYFKVAEGVYDASDFDFGVYATAHEPIGEYDADSEYDQCVFDYPASGIVGMAWGERIPCSFKLTIPGRLPSPRDPATPAVAGGPQGEDAGRPANLVSRIGGILPRFRAAGVQAFVDVTEDAWMLGHSVIRNADASSGEGIEYDSTSVRDQNADIFIPFDQSGGI